MILGEEFAQRLDIAERHPPRIVGELELRAIERAVGHRRNVPLVLP